MEFSRRDFIHAGCAITAVILVPNPAEAWIHGVAPSGNNNRVTLNVGPNSWANLAKGMGFNAPPGIADANGYPSGVLASNILANVSLVPGYVGDYIWKWNGTGSMQIAEACLIRQQQLNGVNTSAVVSGVTGTGANFAGDSGGNTTISSQNTPRVQFTPGALIQGIAQGASNGAGGNYIRVTFKSGYVNNFSGAGTASSQIIKLQNSAQSGGGNVSVAAAIDTWNYVVVDSSNIDLTTSTTTGAASVWTTNGIAGGEAITTASNLHIYMLASTFTSFTNLVICASANETPITNGAIWDPTLVSQYQYLMNSASAPASQKGWLRFMDSSGVQGSYECDFANRIPASYISYTSIGALDYYPPAYQAGAITNGGSDAYTCSDPSQTVWSGSAYIDNAIVQGAVDVVNATQNPTLNIGGHGAKPIFDFGTNPFIFRISAPAASAGLNMVFTFSAAGWTSPQLNGGSNYTFTYTTVSADTGSVAALNGNLVNALIADTTLAAAMILFGNSGQVTAYPRTAEAGALTITYTSGPAICTIARMAPGISVTSGTYTSATGVLVLNFAAGNPIGWGFNFNSPDQVSGMIGTGAVSSLNGSWNVASSTSTSVTFSVPVGLGAITITGGFIGDGGATLPANGKLATFIYNKILGGWIYRANGLTFSIPFESIVDLCNRVGAHCWYNWPVYTKASFITALTQFMGDATTGLTSGLRFGTELGNELWNFSQGPYGKCLFLAAGIGIYPGGNDAQQWSWGALRAIQYGALAKAAWTGKGRNASDYYVFNMGNQPSANPGQSYQQYALEGLALTTSNLVYNAWSGLAGGLGPADYSTSGNRPADKYLTASGHATYWFPDYIQQVAQNIEGTVTDNSNWLTASLNYANGSTAAAFSALATMFSTQRGSATVASGTYNSGTGILSLVLNAPINAGTAASGDIVHIYNMTGVGSSIAALNGGGFSATAGTSGTTMNLNVGTGKTITSISGGTVIDETASGVNPAQASNWIAFARAFANFETIAETYDSTRAANSLPKLGIMHYEGAPQWSVGSSALNGTNSTTDTGPLISQITSLGWNVSAYTVSGTNNVTEVAQQVLNMVQGWKHDTDINGNPANTGSYKNMIKTNYYGALVAASAGKSREVKPAQYGYQGSIWGLFPVSYTLGNQYTNYDAIHEFNA